MALNGFLQRLGLQKDLRTRPREGVWGREEDECVCVCVCVCVCACVCVCVCVCMVVMVVGGERDGADAGGI